MIYQIIATYFKDDCADGLTYNPVMTAVLNKHALASKPTLSQFWRRMDKDALKQFEPIVQKMRQIIYTLRQPEQMLFDLDSTRLNT